ncbi:sugar ABC transporter ATP-binding protein [Paraburkholderia heleia]|uniref:sugar ABC transporter ATP-binding protein n=1 Tax=Paraburkholderia heleia TaxID=634127 RepID=UPI0005AAE75E|nr:sugar ABC transporter ATP-binding protein [Paraburkholderia heleia]
MNTGSTDHGAVAEVRGAVKRYGGVLALDHVDFAIHAGEVRALLGKNGAGKSTLIRLLAGAERPDTGAVLLGGARVPENTDMLARHAAGAGVRVVYQELSLVPDMSIEENLYLGAWPRKGAVLDYNAMRAGASAALARVGLESVDPRQWVVTLTAAERQLVEIARALMGHPRLVILDEPTSSLTDREARRVLDAVQQMSATGIAVIYVSHRMKEIRQVAQTATVMRDGRASPTHRLAEMSDADIVELMLGHGQAAAPAALRSHVRDEVALSVTGLCAPPKLIDIGLTLRRGEVLGIAGLLGSGRSELVRAIAGLDPVRGGELVFRGERHTRWHYRQLLENGLGFTPESRKEQGIFPQLGVDENIVLTNPRKVSRAGMLSAARIHDAAAAVIRSMGIKAGTPAIPISTLSGGNQQKAVIGRWVHARAQILLLDEPTRGVDVDAKQQIYTIMRALAAEGNSVIFVSSELEELPLVCDRVAVIRDGRIAEELAAPAITTQALMSACLFEASTGDQR